MTERKMTEEEYQRNIKICIFILFCFFILYIYHRIISNNSWNKLINLIENWNYKGEKLNERKLVKELSLFLSDHGFTVHREYRDKDNTIDLVVYLDNYWYSKDRVNIEAKYNLKNKAQLDRLKGQVQGMTNCNGSNIILILGSLDCNMNNRVNDINDTIDKEITIIKNKNIKDIFVKDVLI